MINLRILLLAFFFVFLGSEASYCQEIEYTVKTGSFSYLKGQKKVNIEFTYNNTGVGRFDLEQEYIDTKVTEYNEKNPGDGDKWKEKWFNNKTTRYQPRFIEEFEKFMNRKKVMLSVDTTAQYTLIMNTTYLEPGFVIVISNHDAYIHLDVELVKTIEPDTILAKLEVRRASSAPFSDSFDAADRIQIAYGNAGKGIARFIWKYYLK